MIRKSDVAKFTLAVKLKIKFKSIIDIKKGQLLYVTIWKGWLYFLKEKSFLRLYIYWVYVFISLY